MRASAYLYVITECYPQSGSPWLNQHTPEMICRTEAEAQFIVEDLRRLAKGSGEPIIYEYLKVPFVHIDERKMQDA